jgi:hypothetical protein
MAVARVHLQIFLGRGSMGLAVPVEAGARRRLAGRCMGTCDQGALRSSIGPTGERQLVNGPGVDLVG